MGPPARDNADLYVGYANWKNWDSFFRVDPDASDYFTRECSDIVATGAVILEIGFGAGAFLAWAKERGAYVSGTEAIASLVAEAERRGVEVLPVDIERVAKAHVARFDAVVAFDVFEHFSLTEIVGRLRAIETMLKPGGHLLLRFPNAQSPFGLAPQFGDPTHRVGLSRGVFEQLIQGSSFEIVRYGGSARAPGRGIVTRVVRLIRYALQGAIARLLNAIYAQNIPWDAVVVLVLRRTELKAQIRG